MEAKIQSPTLEQSAIVERVARIVSSVRGAKSNYAHLASELEPAIPFDILGIALLRHDGAAVRITVCKRRANGWYIQNHQHPYADSMVEQIRNRQATLSLENVDPTDEGRAEMIILNHPNGLDGPPAQCGDALSGNPPLHATLIAPLVVEDHILGTFELGSTRINAYDDETLQRLISAVARVLAAAIESAQVGGSVEIQDRQREGLKEVSNVLTSKMDLSEILNRIVIGIDKALNVASAIAKVDSQTKSLSLLTQSGIDPAALEAVIEQEDATSDQSILGFTLHNKVTCASQDIARDERFPLSAVFATKLAIHSICAYPLIGSTDYGVLLLCSTEQGGFTPLKADIFALFASQASIAINYSVLLEAARDRGQFPRQVEPLELQLRKNVLGAEAEEDRELLQRIRNERQTIEAALTRAGILGDGGAAPGSVLDLNESQARDASFSQISASATGYAVDPLFVVDLHGRCIYVTPTAEVFCNRPLSERTNSFVDSVAGVLYPASSISLQEAFEILLPRTRNADEVLAYLQAFTLDALDADNDLQSEENRLNADSWGSNILRCVIASEPILKKAPMHFYPPDDHTMSVDNQLLLDEPNDREHGSQRMLWDNLPSDRHYQLKRYPLYDADGQQIANALQVKDITEQVRDEHNRAALLSAVSHDLRTPLTTIKAAVTGLMQPGIEFDAAMLHEILEEIDDQTDHLDTLVNSLVEMSRIQMGALVLDKEWCDVAEIVHTMLSRMGRVLDGRSVRTVFQPHLPHLQVDYVQLGRVFSNLIENAARYSPPGSEIEILLDMITQQDLIAAGVRFEREDVGFAFMMYRGSMVSWDGTFLRARVVDHGSGVPESEREHIFKPFYSLDPRNSGLGLSICRGIIEAHGGCIWVEHVQDGGTCFVFVLPNISS